MVSHSEVVEGAGLEVWVEQELSGVGVDVFPDDPCPHLHVLHQTRTLRGTPPSFPVTQKTFIKVSKGEKIRNQYNQVPHLTQDTNGKVTNSQ